jgi:ABC-type glycerol-3-phosphate transport system substrate-binding protein
MSALVTATGLASAAQADTEKRITFKPRGAGDAQALTTQWLVDQFAERTVGTHKIEAFWAGSIAKTREIPEALAAGVGDFGDIVTPYVPDPMPLNNAVGVFIPQPMKTLRWGSSWKRCTPPTRSSRRSWRARTSMPSASVRSRITACSVPSR